MNLAEFRETQQEPLKQKTLLLLLRDNQILLAMKKRDFGKGRWNGLGGKIQEGESIEEATEREAFEEAGITNPILRKVAELNFYSIPNPAYNQQVILFVATDWQGEPEESEEMAPRWFDLD